MSRGNASACTSMVYSRIDDAGGHGAWLRDAVIEISRAAGEEPPAWARGDQTPDAGPPADTPDAAPAGGAPSGSAKGCAATGATPRGNAWAFLLVAMLVLRRRRSSAERR
jgi:MYXO-CTERM domain-containing protein